jgi:alkylation response protein AidB-like acyl-CoA dehydrogenase
MDFELSPEHQRILAICRRLAPDFAQRAAQHDREASAPMENYALLRQEGLYGLTVPKEYGGLGGGYLGYVVAMEELAQGCASTALSFNMHCVVLPTLFEEPAVSVATRQRMADLAVGEQKLFAYSVSETGASSLLAGATFQSSTQARRVAGGYALRGRKSFQSMIESCDYVIMMVHPEDDPNPMAGIVLLIPCPSRGLRVEEVWDTLGMRGTRSNDVVLEDCFVPENSLLYETDNVAAFYERAAHWGIGYMAVYLGVGAAAFRIACETLSQRVPRGFAQPMSHHPDIRRRVAEMSVDLEAARLLTRYAAWQTDQEGRTPASVAALLRAKYFVGEAVNRITRSALNACGAHALFKSSPLERLLRDGISASIMPPSGDACLFGLGVLELDLNPKEMLPPLKPASGSDK